MVEREREIEHKGEDGRAKRSEREEILEGKEIQEKEHCKG